MSERMVTNEHTGGKKGQKLARFDLIPPRPLTALAEHYGKGAEKYEDRNWERGYDWSLSFGAMQRHAWAFWNGEDIDPENQMPHLAAVAFHAFALLEFAATHRKLDDRPSTLAARRAIQAAFDAAFEDGKLGEFPPITFEAHDDCPPNTAYLLRPRFTLHDVKDF